MKQKVMRLAAMMFASLSIVAMTALTASASTTGTGLGDHSAEITAQFQAAATDIIPIIIGILGVGLGIFVIFKGIKLAKRMFSTVSTG